MKSFVYLLVCDDKFKIGKADNIENRYKQLKKNYTFMLDNSYSIEVEYKEATNLEKTLHCIFEKDRIRDLPQAEGSTEFFKLDCLNDVLHMVENISQHKDIKLKKGIILRPKKQNLIKKNITKKSKYDKNFISLRHTIIYVYYVLKNATRTIEKENECIIIYENVNFGLGKFLSEKVFRKATKKENGGFVRVFSQISGRGCPHNDFECEIIELKLDTRVIIEYFKNHESKTYKEKYVEKYIKSISSFKGNI
jgi:hypothetical protein